MSRLSIPEIRLKPVLLIGALVLGCGGGASLVKDNPPEMCLSIRATPQLNLYDGEPHVVSLSFYPLSNSTEFREADAYDLLERIDLAGQTGKVWDTTLLPGEERSVKEMLPRDTALIGIVADFFSGPARVLLEPGCGPLSRGVLVVTSGDIQIQ